jgi:hypothetical protein
MRDDLEACDLPPLAVPAAPAPPAIAPPPKHGSKRAVRQGPRSRTVSLKVLTREELRQGALMYPPVDEPRPRTRGECAGAARPCPWVGCKHHLYLDVSPDTGSIQIVRPDLEPWELPHTCALDVADAGERTLDEVGQVMNVTRERVRQLEVRALLKIKMASPSPDEVGANAGAIPPAGRRRRRTPGR